MTKQEALKWFLNEIVQEGDLDKLVEFVLKTKAEQLATLQTWADARRAKLQEQLAAYDTEKQNTTNLINDLTTIQ